MCLIVEKRGDHLGAGEYDAFEWLYRKMVGNEYG